MLLIRTKTLEQKLYYMKHSIIVKNQEMSGVLNLVNLILIRFTCFLIKSKINSQISSQNSRCTFSNNVPNAHIYYIHSSYVLGWQIICYIQYLFPHLFEQYESQGLQIYLGSFSSSKQATHQDTLLGNFLSKHFLQAHALLALNFGFH